MKFLLIAVSALFCLAPGLDAQRGKTPEPKVVRTTTKDAEGKLQWDKFVPANCSTCKGSKVHKKCLHCGETSRFKGKCLDCAGKKKSPCRACAGQGKAYDPLKFVICPGCQGAAAFPCHQCANEGTYPVAGGGKKPAKCNGCKGAGGHACVVCKGQRLVPAPKVSPDLAEAPMKKLLSAQTAIKTALANVQSLRMLKSTSKTLKAYSKAIKPARKVLPSLKKSEAMFKAVMKGMAKGDIWEGNRQRTLGAMTLYRDYNVFYLKHQLQVVDLCIKRAKANEQAGK